MQATFCAKIKAPRSGELFINVTFAIFVAETAVFAAVIIMTIIARPHDGDAIFLIFVLVCYRAASVNTGTTAIIWTAFFHDFSFLYNTSRSGRNVMIDTSLYFVI